MTGPVDLMKVDVEGAEPQVFAGAPRLLNQPDAPVLIFEELGHTTEARRTLLDYTAAAYEFWLLRKDKAIVPYGLDQHSEWCDVLAVPGQSQTPRV